MKSKTTVNVVARKSIVLFIMLLLTLLFLTDLHAQGRTEQNKILIYTPYSSYQMDPLIKKFNTVHPEIVVEYLPGGKEEILTMVDLEIKTGQVKGDIMMGIDALTAIYLGDSLQAYQPSDVNSLVQSVRDPKGRTVAYGTNFVVIQYNTKSISKNDVPKGFADLLNPKFNNKMSHADPSQSGTANLAVYFLTHYCLDKFGSPFGWEYYEKLATLNPLILSGQGGVRDYVETGERPLGLEQSITMIIPSMANGEPTDYVLPIEGCPSSIDSAGIFKGAPNPTAAKLFIDFLISEAGQISVSDDIGLAPVRKGVSFRLPNGESMDEVNLVPVAQYLTQEKKAEMSQRFKQIVRK